MYMNRGSYNQLQILKSSTVDLIKTLQYPGLLFPDMMGLIWFFKYGFFKHGGFFPGAQAEYGFSWDNKSGMICMGNSANQDWSWFMEYLLLSYSRHYEPFSVEGIILSDSDGDGLLESGEFVQMVVDIRNNVNITESVPDIQLQINSFDSNINIDVAESTSGNMNYLEMKDNHNLPFTFEIDNGTNPYTTSFSVSVSSGGVEVYQVNIDIEVGAPDVLVVNDGTSFGGLFMQPDFWYKQVFDSIGRKVFYYDLNLFGEPGYEFISNFPVVVWFTGIQSEYTLTAENQLVLSQYLDSGGNLFVSGQNISEDIQDSPFLADYLHVKQLNGTYSGQDTIIGIAGDPIGNDLVLTMNQGWDALYQHSMSELQAVNGGEMSFNYFSSFSSAMVRYSSPMYKTVFMGFGFEGINGFHNRLLVMDRILDYFEETVNIDDKTNGKMVSDLFVRLINPLSQDQTIRYELYSSAKVKISICDLDGRQIYVFNEGYLHAGIHCLDVNTARISPGLYLCRFTDGISEYTEKLIINQ
jgi:hypothetical protein